MTKLEAWAITAGIVLALLFLGRGPLRLLLLGIGQLGGLRAAATDIRLKGCASVRIDESVRKSASCVPTDRSSNVQRAHPLAVAVLRMANSSVTSCVII